MDTWENFDEYGTYVHPFYKESMTLFVRDMRRFAFIEFSTAKKILKILLMGYIFYPGLPPAGGGLKLIPGRSLANPGTPMVPECS